MNEHSKEILHVNAIQQIMSSYCRFVDSKQWQHLRDLLGSDIKLTFQDEAGKVLNNFDSADTFTKICDDFIGDAATAHHLHNPENTLSGETEANGIWAMEDRMYMQKADRPFFHGLGHYHVRFVRVAERWQIRELLLTRVRLVIHNKTE